jgi:hybrid polyketide synthase/nonribosomal peptide synthetase ACE1
VANLYKLLGMRPEDGAISPSTPLIELGIDSLVAVDMRVWFTRELDLDLPILKLLGGATVEDMVEDAVARLAPALIPNVKDAPKEAEAAPAAEPSAEGAAPQDSVEQETSGEEDAASSSGASDELALSVASTMLTPPLSDGGSEEAKDGEKEC